MSAEASEIVVAAAGGGVGFWLVRLLVDRFVARADKREEAAEASGVKKLDTVLSVVTELKQEFAVMGTKMIQQTASVEALRERIDGIGNNHGPKLDSLAERVTRVETQLEERLPRFSARGA